MQCSHGDVAEWLKAAVSKTAVGETLPEVRLLSSPPSRAQLLRSRRVLCSDTNRNRGYDNQGNYCNREAILSRIIVNVSFSASGIGSVREKLVFKGLIGDPFLNIAY